MDITYFGHSSFKIKTKLATLITDPFDPEMVGLKFPKEEADIVTISHDHKDHNMESLVTNVHKVIRGPGEYEVKGVSIIGLSSFHDNKEGAERGKNTIYVIEAEGLRIAHLGDLGHDLTENDLENIGDINILMLPVGGEYTIGSVDAAKIYREIEPNFVIPMHFKTPGLKEDSFGKLTTEEDFIKEIGVPSETLPKLSVRKEDLTEGQNPRAVVLQTK